MRILSTALPELTILLWESTWEEIKLLWEVFDEIMSSTTTQAQECFSALRYVAFGASSSFNRARMRANVKDAGGAQLTAWQETALVAGEALGVRLELDYLRYPMEAFP
jgi:hypothetical protein